VIITNYSYSAPAQTLQNRIVRFAFLFFVMAMLMPGQGYPKDTLFLKLKKTIVINPGHGGNDNGAKGADGTVEKNVALSLSRALAEKLGPSFNVISTRTGDYDVAIASRTETANRAEADLMISLHVGGNYTHGKQGIGIFYFQAPSSEKAGTKNIESLEGESPSRISWENVQEKYVSISRNMAQSLSEKLSQNPSYPAISVEALPIAVLSGADMPAILIEAGNLSHPYDEKKLRDSDYLLRLSTDIAAALTGYFDADTQAF
jgi:N-acetylmuramoyl-L-alanine amidase